MLTLIGPMSEFTIRAENEIPLFAVLIRLSKDGANVRSGDFTVSITENGKRIKPIGLFLAMLVVLLIFSSCGSDEPEAATATPAVPATHTVSPLPIAASASTSPLSAPESPLPPAAEQRTGDATTGVVTGQIIVHAKDGDKPVNNMIFALAVVLRDEDGVAKVAGYDAANSPKTVTDAQGNFLIEDVPVGTYTLILDAVLKSHMLSYPSTEETILVEVKAGEVTNTGLLEYDSLPLPGFSSE